MRCFLWISVLTFHTLPPLNPSNNLVRDLHFRDHRARGGGTQICLTPERRIWSHFTHEGTEPPLHPTEVKWLAQGHQPVVGELGLNSDLPPRGGCFHWASPKGEESAGSWSVFLLCFKNRLSSFWQNEHFLDPYCVSRTSILNQKQGWHQCDKAILFCIKQQEELTFCRVFVPKQWWCLNFLAIQSCKK